GTAGTTGTAGGTATSRRLNVFECFLATSFRRKSRHSVKRRLVLESSCQRAARPLLARGSTVRAYAGIAAHWSSAASFQLRIPSCSIFRFMAFLQELYSALRVFGFGNRQVCLDQ